MHHLPDLARLDNQGCLHALAHRDEVVVDGTHGQQGWYGDMGLIDIAVAEDDVVVAFVDALLGIMAQAVESIAQARFALPCLKEDGQLDGVEALVTDVAEDVELRVGEDGVGQTHHLAV